MNENNLWNKSYSLDELNYLAENTMIEVLPRIKTSESNKISFLSYEFEQFKINKPSKVPLWMGIKLVQQGKCDIKIPYWLNDKALSDILINEQQSDDLSELCYYFFEIYNILVNKLPELIHNIELVKILFSDIISIRNKKLNNKLIDIKDQKYYYTIKNICAKEIESIRKIITESLDLKHDLLGKNNY